MFVCILFRGFNGKNETEGKAFQRQIAFYLKQTNEINTLLLN